MRKRTINPLPQKLNGYQKIPRERFTRLIKEMRMSGGEFLLFEFCLAIADWDKNHKTYASFDTKLDEISEVLGIPRSTVGYQLKKLRENGYIFDGQDGRIHIKDFERYVWTKVVPNSVKKSAENFNDENTNQETGYVIQIPDDYDSKENEDFDPG